MPGEIRPLLTIDNLSKRFGDVTAVQDISLTADAGDILCLLGPSGCGKTTLLRLIAGLERPDRGQILFAGQDISQVPVHERNFGFMFQDYALFPHKNVVENVIFGLRMGNWSPQERARRAQEMLSLVGLTGLDTRPVGALSGGEQQRVALARSLAPSPRLLLLDEPLGSLDRALRERLLNELRAILREVKVTAISVTHDQQEAFALADKVVVMNAGRTLQVAAPEMLYRQPASPTVARFLGLTNLLTGQVVQLQPLALQTAIGRIQLPNPGGRRWVPGEELTVLLRPEAVSTCASEHAIPLQVALTGCSFRGRHYQVEVQHPSGQSLTFIIRTSPQELPALGQEVELFLDPDGISLLPADHTATSHP